MQQQSRPEGAPLTQAQMARAVQRGLQLEQQRRATKKAAAWLGLICAFVFAIAATYAFHNDWAQWTAVIIGLFLPLYLMRHRI